MTTHGSVARSVREAKEKYPERYCPTPGCLWRTGDGSYCPRHYKQMEREAARAVANLRRLLEEAT